MTKLKGGIITYAAEAKKLQIPSKFRGKNFVFDERMSEPITTEVLSECHVCATKCDTKRNCKNEGYFFWVFCTNEQTVAMLYLISVTVVLPN